jgi:non-specific serine/threonine protein kinase
MIINEERMRTYAGDIIFNRGFTYYLQGRVRIIELSDTYIKADVRGSGTTYLVEWFFNHETEHWLAHCNCPYDSRAVCKHIVATGLQANHLYERGVKSLNTQRNNKATLAKIFRTDQLKNHNPSRPEYRLIFKLSFRDKTWSLTPVARHVKKDGTLGRERYIGASYELDNEQLRLSRKERFAAQWLWSTGETNYHWHTVNQGISFAYGSELGPLLPTLRECSIRLEGEDIPVAIHPKPLQLRICLRRKQAGTEKLQFELQSDLDDNDTFKTILDNSFRLLTGGDVILYRDFTLYEVKENIDSRFLFPFLSPSGKVEFGSDELDTFYKSILPHLSATENLVGLPEDMAPAVCSTITARILYLQEKNGNLIIHPVFEYGPGNEVEYTLNDRVIILKNNSGFVRIHRQDKVELYALQVLREHGLTDSEAGWFYPDRKKNPIAWLFEELPQLAAAGFTILGEEKLDKLKVRRAAAKLVSTVSSGQDWFDLQVEIDFDGMRVSVEQILKNHNRNKNYITLNNGYTIQIDEQILKKIGFVNTFGQKTEDHRVHRFSKSHLLLLEQILDDSDSQKSDAAYKKSLARIKNFTAMKEKTVPRSFKGELRTYQKAGFNWLHFLKEFGFGGCLADDMGLGKTVQALAFLQDVIADSKGKPILVVTPTSVIYNWAREIERFTPLLEYYVYHGTEREKDYEVLNNSNIILTSYALVWRDYAFLEQIDYYYIILDESQKIKNAGALTTRSIGSLRSDYRLALTGTPLENNLSELWSQFNFLNPGMLGTLKAFQNNFGRAIELAGDEQMAKKLRKIIYPFILRRKKEEVAGELPPKTEIVTFCDMEKKQRQIYEKWRDYYRAAVLNKIDEDGLNRSKIKVLEGLTRLRQICIHPDLVEGKNGRLQSEKFNYLFEQLAEILSENHKVLVFSQFVKALSLLRRQLDEKAIVYAYLDGHTSKRSEEVDRFQNEEACKVFLISLKAGGTGLNLTAADYVFLLDPWWNPAVELQASDRAHRIGQNRQVFVYKLISKNSVEEKILTLQQKKSALVDNIIRTDGAFFKTLSKEDIEGLFS